MCILFMQCVCVCVRACVRACVYILLKVVSLYDLSVLPLSVMGLQKKFG